MTKVLTLWEKSISFHEGWFIYSDGIGHNSVISYSSAREIELEYYKYQASQDIDRGGCEPSAAYSMRGILETKNSDGTTTLSLKKYNTESFYNSCNKVSMTGLLTIPDEIGGFPINFVADKAFYNCNGLEEVILPDSIQSIGRQAFFGCTSLKKLIIPVNNKSIGFEAFEHTQLVFSVDNQSPEVHILGNTLVSAEKNITGVYTVPETVTIIAEEAFKDCSELEKLVLHDNVKNIGNSAFAGCSSLREIRMPKSVDSLGFGAFTNCYSLIGIIVPHGVSVLNHFYGCRSLEKVTLPDSVISIDFKCFYDTALINKFNLSNENCLIIGKWLIAFRSDRNGHLSIPEGVIGVADQDWNTMTRNEVFNFRKLTSLSIPSGVKYIGRNAFSFSGISEVSLPDGLERLDVSAFRGAELTSITIPASVSKIEQWVLMDCERLNTVIFKGNTEVIWPAITGKRDRSAITLISDNNESVMNYVKEYGKKYNLKYRESSSAELPSGKASLLG